MRILMIAPVSPMPMNTGGRVRIFKILEGLSRQHEVTFVFPATKKNFRPPELGQLYENKALIRPVECRPITLVKKLAGLLSSNPYHMSIWYDPALQKEVFLLLSKHKFDVVYCHFIYTVPYVINCGIPIFVDAHNVDRDYWSRKVDFYKAKGDLFKSWISKRNLNKIILFEDQILPVISGLVCMSQSDLDQMHSYAQCAPNLKLLVAPNGVDTQSFTHSLHKETQQKSNRVVLGFFGSLHLDINKDAARLVCNSIFPEVQRQLPDYDISLLVIGRDPPKSLCNRVPKTLRRKISILGTVTDVRPFLVRVDVLVLPLRQGAGSKLRTLEAFSSGVCVVGSSLAFIGLEGFEDGKHAISAETVSCFVDRIQYVIRNPDIRKSISREARNFALNFDWASITRTLSCELLKSFDI